MESMDTLVIVFPDSLEHTVKLVVDVNLFVMQIITLFKKNFLLLLKT